MKQNQGLIQIYTGNGKGKTTAAIGLANRATAHGLKVTFIQFLKAETDKKTITQNSQINYFHFGLNYKKYGWLKKDESGQTQSQHLEKFQQIISKAWQFTTQAIQKEECDLLILDELNLALYFNLLDAKEIINIIKHRPKHLEIVITGRQCPRELIEIADLVTEMKEIKHPYQKGITARPGIDY